MTVTHTKVSGQMLPTFHSLLNFTPATLNSGLLFPPTIRILAHVRFSAFQAVTGFLQDLVGQLLDVAPRLLDVM